MKRIVIIDWFNFYFGTNGNTTTGYQRAERVKNAERLNTGTRQKSQTRSRMGGGFKIEQGDYSIRTITLMGTLNTELPSPADAPQKSAFSDLSMSSGSRTDTERLDWIERKQLSGEFLHDAIHWDGRVFRECIDEAMDEENART